LVYPLGIPLLYFIVLFRKKDEFDPIPDNFEESQRSRSKNPELKPYIFLFLAYQPHAWWFEVYECFRRLLLSAALVFFLDGTSMQIVIGITIAILSIKLYAIIEPFVFLSTSYLAEICQWSIFAILFSGLLIKSQVTDSSEEHVNEELFDVILVAINLIAPVCAIFMFTTLLLNQNEASNNIHTPKKDTEMVKISSYRVKAMKLGEKLNEDEY